MTPLFLALNAIECRTTCGQSGIWAQCDATSAPTPAPTRAAYTIAGPLLADRADDQLPVYSVDYTDSLTRYGFAPGVRVELQHDSGVWLAVGTFVSFDTDVAQPDVRILVLDQSVTAVWGGPAMPDTHWRPEPVTTQAPPPPPTASPTSLEDFCAASSSCGKTCEGDCGWSRSDGRCVPGETTTRADRRRGWGCARTDEDRCNVFHCAAQCSTAPGCGWSKHRSRCVEGGTTTLIEMGMGLCDVPTNVEEFEGSFSWIPSYNTAAAPGPMVAAGATPTGQAELRIRSDGTAMISVEVAGLTPGTEYKAHLHAAPCADEAGGHYQMPGCGPDCQATAVTEMWPGLTTGADGAGENMVASTWTPLRSDIQHLSVVIHDTPNGNVKMLCTDLIATRLSVKEFDGGFDWIPSYATAPGPMVTSGAMPTGISEMLLFSDGRTLVNVEVAGLTPGTEYKAHLHSRPCSEEAGGHYMDPNCGDECEVNAMNENWPIVTITGDGSGTGVALSEWMPAQTAQPYLSVIIHDTPNGNVKMLCSDLIDRSLLPVTTTTTEEPANQAQMAVSCSDITCSRHCGGDCGWSSKFMICKDGARTSAAEYLADFGTC